MKISRSLLSRKATRSGMTIAGKKVPLWATSRKTRGTVAVTGSTRRLFRAFASRNHGTTVP